MHHMFMLKFSLFLSYLNVKVLQLTSDIFIIFPFIEELLTRTKSLSLKIDSLKLKSQKQLKNISVVLPSSPIKMRQIDQGVHEL